jgi:two-component system, OmpR family, phosphate regulon sensor histidine kinase PhoR
VAARPLWALGLACAGLLLVLFLAAGVRSERLWAGAVLLILAGIVGALVLSRTFSARIDRLKDFAGRMAGGDLRPMALDRTPDELTEVARTLNQTAARLEGMIRAPRDEANRSAAILRSMVEGVAVVDADERLIFCNDAFSNILGLASGNYDGQPLIEIVRQPDLLAALRAALGSGEAIQSEAAIGTVLPRSFSITAATVPTLSSSHEPGSDPAQPQSRGAVMVLHDISELRNLERIRRDFVANVSHEFKTPLTAIQGFAETLLAGALEDPRNNRRFLEIIRDHSLRLARLTDDLLKLARIEAGKLDLNFAPTAIAEIVAPCMETLRFKAAQRQITVEVDCPEDFPAVRADVVSLREVLQNLCDNAVQYTPAGGSISVRAALQDGEAVVSVVDTGIGIPQREQSRIFERFYRVDAARSREAGGTGLGLAIAKHIVEAHGGRLWVESAVGQGSQFHFSVLLAV